ncbi:Conserved_hypothetical protein [Hexamita inflata]|uniref:Uncharacterized protein n=1 Tax=Hexamita inflata TaxID=28002 RepID=A0AA86U8G7_9EUKA|nr:Conserved hypothetical protein [Hexamita inflata]
MGLSNSCSGLSEQFQTLKLHQLINIVKIDACSDLYLSVKQNKIKLFNQQLQLLREYDIGWCHYEQRNSIQQSYTYYDLTKEDFPQLLQAVICQGKIYFQYMEYIYVLTSNTIQRVAQIPGVKLNEYDSFHGRLFSFNNTLYVSNRSGYLYQLSDSKLKLVKQFSGNFFQFCNNVIVWNYFEQKVSVLQPDLSEKFLCSTENSFDVMFSQGGALVIKSLSKNSFVVVDMINLKAVQVEHDLTLTEKHIWQYIQLGPTGLQLSVGILDKLFGKQFQQQMVNEQEAYSYGRWNCFFLFTM